MTRGLLFASVMVFFLGLVPGLSYLPTAGATVHPWRISDLGTQPIIATGLNSSGEVVGITVRDTVGAPSHAFLYKHARYIDLGIPRGYFSSGASGISDGGVILAHAYSRKLRRTFEFSVVKRGQRWVWQRIRTGIPGYYSPDHIAAIAANGDMAGSITRPEHHFSERAAIWVPSRSNTYARATILPVAARNERAIAISIWSDAGHLVVGGWQQDRGGERVPAIWTGTGDGDLRLGNDVAGIWPELIGGKGRNVYCAGEAPGQSASYGESVTMQVGRVLFGATTLSKTVDLASGSSSGSPGASGVTAGADGKLLAVGDTRLFDGHPKAVIWHGLGDGGSTYSRPLQTYLPSASPWTLTVATAINSRGQILGLGVLRNQVHYFLLTPR